MLIDTEAFPYTNEYDINLWYDTERSKLFIIAYELDWEEDEDNEGEYIHCLNNYDNPIQLCDIDDATLKAWDFYVDDHWTTRTHFETEFAHLPMLIHIMKRHLESLPAYEAFLP